MRIFFTSVVFYAFIITHSKLKMYEDILRFVVIEFECWFNGMPERENSWGGKRER